MPRCARQDRTPRAGPVSAVAPRGNCELDFSPPSRSTRQPRHSNEFDRGRPVVVACAAISTRGRSAHPRAPGSEPMKKIGSAVLIILGQVFAASLASADTANTLSDPRDYQGLAVAPNGTFSAYAYFRHVSAAVDSAGHGENLSQTLGVARANYLLKFGNLSIVPIDLTLPYADATVYVPQPMSPFGQTLNNTGLADLTYLPTIGYTIHEGEEIHTILAATIYVTAPTGNYNAPDLIYIGDNRWRFQGSLIAAQRYKMLTFDLVGDVTGYTNNRNFIVPLPGMGGMTTPTTEAIMQDPSIGVERSEERRVGKEC